MISYALKVVAWLFLADRLAGVYGLAVVFSWMFGRELAEDQAGAAGHAGRAFDFVAGELVVHQGGDQGTDVNSLPLRTASRLPWLQGALSALAYLSLLSACD